MLFLVPTDILYANNSATKCPDHFLNMKATSPWGKPPSHGQSMSHVRWFSTKNQQSQQAPGCQPDSDSQRYRSTRVAPKESIECLLEMKLRSICINKQARRFNIRWPRANILEASQGCGFPKRHVAFGVASFLSSTLSGKHPWLQPSARGAGAMGWKERHR